MFKPFLRFWLMLTWHHHEVSSDFSAAYPWQWVLYSVTSQRCSFGLSSWKLHVHVQESSWDCFNFVTWCVSLLLSWYTLIIKGWTWSGTILSWYQEAQNVPRKYFPTVLHHHIQPEPLIQERMDLRYVVHSRFWPYCLGRVQHLVDLNALIYTSVVIIGYLSYCCMQQEPTKHFHLDLPLTEYLRDGYAGKFHVVPINDHVTQHHLNHLPSSFWCAVWTLAGALTMFACINVLSCFHVICWLDIVALTTSQVYLTK